MTAQTTAHFDGLLDLLGLGFFDKSRLKTIQMTPGECFKSVGRYPNYGATVLSIWTVL